MRLASTILNVAIGLTMVAGALYLARHHLALTISLSHARSAMSVHLIVANRDAAYIYTKLFSLHPVHRCDETSRNIK